jgi:peroxiredoxin (alkyl hydroperoxide reductase subunit C)
MLPVGSQAPDFTLKDQNNQEVRLADLRGRKNVLLVFYPLTFTGTCQGELSLIRDDLATYQNDTVQVLAISVDSAYAHKVWAEREGFDFPLLADFWPHGAVATSYDAFRDTAGVAHRATYLIDTAGVIRFAELIGPGESRDAAIWRAALAELAAPAR